MTTLSVNVNKIATLRNSRGQDHPSVIQVVRDLVSYNVKGITVHPRPDERHIKKSDVLEIYKFLNAHNKNSSEKVEFNIEGYPSKDFLKLIQKTKPDQATLVPDPPNALTSNAGWKLSAKRKFLIGVCQQLKKWNVRSSLFIDPYDFSAADLKALTEIGADRVELYTERYAKTFATPRQDTVLKKYQECAKKVTSVGVELNAGHDLNQKNLANLISAIPEIKEVSIGHALICEALYDGLKSTVNKYHSILGVF